ncbi:ATP-binding protein [Catenulispora pinisilvae]|uniref:ATP-binding protein n=1 Tax=Catenulispora pinisilvae TaxID=2705253 RepID=UPI001891FE4A|nr:ATP-binding protein [Catenulispora pinisilvae]
MDAQSSAVGTVAKTESATAVLLRFTPQPEHVRTARLVAVAHARRVGVEAGLLDEVRLAVGEACSRAVGLHQRHCPGEPVVVVLDAIDESGSGLVADRFVVTVADKVSGAVPAPRAGVGAGVAEGAEDEAAAEGEPAAQAEIAEDDDEDLDDAEMGLAVLTGLVDDLDITSGPDGGSVRMGWPVKDF